MKQSTIWVTCIGSFINMCMAIYDRDIHAALGWFVAFILSVGIIIDKS